MKEMLENILKYGREGNKEGREEKKKGRTGGVRTLL